MATASTIDIGVVDMYKYIFGFGSNIKANIFATLFVTTMITFYVLIFYFVKTERVLLWSLNDVIDYCASTPRQQTERQSVWQQQ